MKRRKFINNLLWGSAGISLPISFNSCNLNYKKISFGICADVHKDVIHDANSRLAKFIQQASDNLPDFIIQMGDFCRPYDYNRNFLSIWNSYEGEKHHVIGNHDMDGGFSRQEVIEFWDSPSQYYSFGKNGYHFIVLDGNDENPSSDKASGYARFVGKEQIDWLASEIRTV